MKKTVKAWACFNPWCRILFETVDTDKTTVLIICHSYNEIRKGYRALPITITYDDGRKP